MGDYAWLWFTITTAIVVRGAEESRDTHRYRAFRPHHNDHRHWGPFFEELPANASSPSEFSSGGVYALAVPAGGPLHLDCRVAMLHDKTVMWVKKTAERVSLLTLGPALYSADTRLNLRFLYPNNWRLEISPILEGDDGLYMCQVSTHPPRVLATNLTVLSPEVLIVDEQGEAVNERHYQEGSKIELRCRALLGSTTNQTKQKIEESLSWEKEGQPSDFHIKPTTSRSGETAGLTTIVSKLVIQRAIAKDSGVYSCHLENRARARVNVHVLQGERQAAVHHETSKAQNHQVALLTFFSLSFLL